MGTSQTLMVFRKTMEKFFINGMLNYYKIKKKLRTNNTIENYNKQLKIRYGKNKNLNWPEFMDMLLKEENYFNEKIEKDLYANNQINLKNNQFSNKLGNKIETDILNNNDGNVNWLLTENNSCRIDSFLTNFIFCIYPFIDINEIYQNKELSYLMRLSEEMLKGNYQKLKMDYWLYLNKNGLDIIDNNKGLYKFGCISSLFALFNNCEIFCIKYKKKTACYICGKEIIKENFASPLISLTEYEIKFHNLNNALNQKYFPCKTTCHNCNKTSKERETNLDSVTTYYDMKMPEFLIFIVDMDYNKLKNYDNDIINIFKQHLELTINNNEISKYNFISCVTMPNEIHYSIYFFNLKSSYNGMKINEYYWHDGSLNEGELIYSKNAVTPLSYVKNEKKTRGG